eukprot:scaffold1388_cov390-Prasinococcus_capsulatus_cf.AAC.25
MIPGKSEAQSNPGTTAFAPPCRLCIGPSSRTGRARGRGSRTARDTVPPVPADGSTKRYAAPSAAYQGPRWAMAALRMMAGDLPGGCRGRRQECA